MSGAELVMVHDVEEVEPDVIMVAQDIVDDLATRSQRYRAIRLRDKRDCRKFLSRLINQVDRGEISCDKARTLTYMVNMLLHAHDLGDGELTKSVSVSGHARSLPNTKTIT